MPSRLPALVNVLVLEGGDKAVARIRSVAPDRLNVVDLAAEFVDELAGEWPGRPGETPPARPGSRPPDEREALVGDAHIVLLGVPFPKTLPRRAPKLMWAHFAFAGVSNLMETDWWGLQGPVLTSSRGVTAALPIAETTVAAALMFAKQLDRASVGSASGKVVPRDELTGMAMVAGKTMGIVGLGGIGTHVARLARGLGMRVVATRRSAERRQRDVDGVDELFPAAQQNDMFAQCDFVAVCAMLTHATTGLIGPDAFRSMKPGAVILNVARGELIDEEALIEALSLGQLGGAYLDVWHGQLEGAPPNPRLLAAPNVVLTPHVSGRGDVSESSLLDLFVRNLTHLLRDEPLENAIDWSRGY